MFVVFAVDGSIHGNGGCNKFFGSLQKTEAGLVVSELGSTRMACPADIMDRENAFMQALQQTQKFEVGQNRLQLLGENNELLAELVSSD